MAEKNPECDLSSLLMHTFISKSISTCIYKTNPFKEADVIQLVHGTGKSVPYLVAYVHMYVYNLCEDIYLLASGSNQQ